MLWIWTLSFGCVGEIIRIGSTVQSNMVLSLCCTRFSLRKLLGVPCAVVSNVKFQELTFRHSSWDKCNRNCAVSCWNLEVLIVDSGCNNFYLCISTVLGISWRIRLSIFLGAKSTVLRSFHLCIEVSWDDACSIGCLNSYGCFNRIQYKN